MSKRLASQALDSLLKAQASSSAHSTKRPSSASSAAPVSTGRVTKKRKASAKTKTDGLPATKTGLKKLKHQQRYGHSVKKIQEEKEANENPLDKLKSQAQQEDETREKNLEYFKLSGRVSKKELELRKKILKYRKDGRQSAKAVVEEESDGDDY